MQQINPARVQCRIAKGKFKVYITDSSTMAQIRISSNLKFIIPIDIFTDKYTFK